LSFVFRWYFPVELCCSTWLLRFAAVVELQAAVAAFELKRAKTTTQWVLVVRLLLSVLAVVL
jgi:hypothetical protein